MKFMKARAIAAAGGLAAVSILAGAAPAHAANLVDPFDCVVDFSGQYLTFDTQVNGTVIPWCYANSGGIAPGDYGYVISFSSGNNAGWFTYQPGDGWIYEHTFPKWQFIAQNYGTIDWLNIN